MNCLSYKLWIFLRRLFVINFESEISYSVFLK